MSEEELEILENFIKYFYKNKENGNKANLTVLVEEITALEHLLQDYKLTVENYKQQIEDTTILAKALNLNEDAPIDAIYEEINKLKNDYKNLQDSYIVRNKLLEDSTPNSKIREKIEKNNKKIYGSVWISSRYEDKLKTTNVILQELLEDK